jgi:hypothetical protein
MSSPRKLSDAGDELGALLLRMPIPVPEPTAAEWGAQFEQTMGRLRTLGPCAEQFSSVQPGARGSCPRELHEDPERVQLDVLCAPLPPESGEPEPGERSGFDTDFALPSSDGMVRDDLGAPQNSGENESARDCHPRFSTRRRAWLAASSLGTLAAAAAAMLALRRPAHDELVTQSVTESKGSETQALATPNLAPNAPATQSDEATPRQQTEASPLEPAAAPPRAPHGVALRVHGKPSPLASAPDESGATAAKEKSAAASDEPVLTPAAGPTTLGDHPSNGEVMAALSRRIVPARQCLGPTTPSTGVRVTFESKGTVQKIDILNPAVVGEARSCLTLALMAMRVTPFARSQYEVTATVSLPAAKNSIGHE